MAFQQALSGLSIASTELDTIGNNVANANTVGFKQSRAEFSDVFANSLFGVSKTAVGIGAQVSEIAQQFTQGNITSTSNPMDLAISGNGFFRLDTNGAISYTRNGQFQIDRNGNIVNGTAQLTGYPADANGTVIPGTPAPLVVNAASIGAKPTTTATLNLNLDGSATTPSVAFPGVTTPTATPDPKSYNYSTQFTAYDSLGVAHAVTLYFVSLSPTTPLSWNVYTQFDNTQLNATPAAFQTLNFSSSGLLPQDPAPPAPPLPVPSMSVTGLANGAANLSISIDLKKTTEFAGASGVNKEVVDGYANGTLTGVSVDSSGVVNARFSNGQSKAVGQVVLANFANPQGLQSLGGNQWAQTFTSGNPVINAPGSGNAGSIQSAALEDSNVDLTTELVSMITAQRFYQANAQAIKTQDTVLQTLLNI